MESLRKIIYSIILAIASTTAYASSFCDKINENTYTNEIYIIPAGQIYKISTNKKSYVYAAPNTNCIDSNIPPLSRNDRVQIYTEVNGFFSFLYFKENGESIEGWILKKNLSKTNERASP